MCVAVDRRPGSGLCLWGAVSSQLSAAIADSIGAGGIAVEVSQRRLGVRGAFIAVAILSIAIVWLTNPFEVVALSSRAFALFYAMQAGLAVWVSRRTDIGGTKRQVGFAIIGIISLAFGLVTPPYGLCLLISAAIGGMNVVSVMKDVCIILAPMLLILLLIIAFPEIALWLPRTLMPMTFK